jgi:hypothetical protein
MQPLNGGERNAMQVGADDGLVVVAKPERRMKVLRGRAEQAQAGVGALEVPRRQRHRDELLQHPCRIDGGEVLLGIPVARALPARDTR